jgi:hypothetical protein
MTYASIMGAVRRMKAMNKGVRLFFFIEFKIISIDISLQTALNRLSKAQNF